MRRQTLPDEHHLGKLRERAQLACGVTHRDVHLVGCAPLRTEVMAHACLIEQRLHLVPPFGVPRYQEQAAGQPFVAQPPPDFQQRLLFTRPRGRSQQDGVSLAQSKLSPQVAPFTGREQGNGDVQLDVAGDGHPLGRKAQFAKTTGIELRRWQQPRNPRKQGPKEGPYSPHPPVTAVAHARIDADHRHFSPSGLGEVLRPAFTFRKNDQVRIHPTPRPSGKNPPIQRKILHRHHLRRIPLPGQTVTGAGRGREVKLDSRIVGKRLQDRSDRQHLAHADRLQPDPPASGRHGRQRFAGPETMGKILPIPAAAPHAQQIVRRRHE